MKNLDNNTEHWENFVIQKEQQIQFWKNSFEVKCKILSLSDESDETATFLIKTLDDVPEHRENLQAQRSKKSNFEQESFMIHQKFCLWRTNLNN